eukprot:9111069-Pyramimonas_sp.AAC.1
MLVLHGYTSFWFQRSGGDSPFLNSKRCLSSFPIECRDCSVIECHVCSVIECRDCSVIECRVCSVIECRVCSVIECRVCSVIECRSDPATEAIPPKNDAGDCSLSGIISMLEWIISMLEWNHKHA